MIISQCPIFIFFSINYLLNNSPIESNWLVLIDPYTLNSVLLTPFIIFFPPFFKLTVIMLFPIHILPSELLSVQLLYIYINNSISVSLFYDSSFSLFLSYILDYLFLLLLLFFFHLLILFSLSTSK